MTSPHRTAATDHAQVLDTLVREWVRLLPAVDPAPDAHFFTLGGQSLDAVRLCSSLGRRWGIEVPLDLVFSHPRLGEQAAALAEHVERARPTRPTVHAVPRDGRLALSAAQERMVLRDHRLDAEGRPPYVRVTPWAGRVRGPLDTAALQQALDGVAVRHEALRCVFEVVDGQPRVRVVDPDATTVPLVVTDLSGTPVDEADPSVGTGTAWPDASAGLDRALVLAVAESDRPHSRRTSPRLRAHLWRLGPDDGVLLLVVDHIVSDAASVQVLLREVGALYRTAVTGQAASAADLPDLPVQLLDHNAWQRSWLQGEALESLVRYWQPIVQPGPFFPELRLPFCRSEARPTAFQGVSHLLALGDTETRHVLELSRASGTTLLTVVLASLQGALALETGNGDVTVGVPDSGRLTDQAADLIGWFSQTVLMRTDLTGDPTFQEAVARVHGTVVAAQRHRGLGFAAVTDHLAGTRRSAPVSMVYLDVSVQGDDALRLPHCSVETLTLPITASGLGLSIWATLRDDALHLSVIHGLELYDPEPVRAFLDRWLGLLAAGTASPGRRLSDLVPGRTWR